ncbi:MAG: DUF1853 family protein [Flavobacteriia bacterium]|nr:DUF1853 family protein [Flavobacteriia bacterium]OIP46553.1 MAG: hypothetical protein AUK46_08420 [Flavobacteriaceae bacterium CG2_30_31_66]PIV96494.1 MAG: DUF1853 domain-containing protein [Flavobacteriaceae bacterium CG17_big_fil_post_rev_8_21_14_2_50_31_13]PIX14740.1 MAG: DUF1853 domain-containing protein [Flavobacteriaceae bacterium CG_4_8_14_3_um_filter_31_8]PIY15116.1 MAG: DUF1853 domain-containing protein [Flavobacteriaceae bacterium CG_4_10_14_3_um_filter_31_253]PIZ09755.1 MAG: DUF1
MQPISKNIQNRYKGFLETPSLWLKTSLLGLQPFIIPKKFTKISIKIDENQRLGKYIERFVSFQLRQEKGIEILAENIQIQREKLTLGELDGILLRNNELIHIEIVYKFYLYDERVGQDEIAHFIGPNRKDSLIEKLNKLSEKQLPLLHSDETKNHLKSIGILSKNISQQVYFKAQLFMPFSEKTPKLNIINNDCIAGFYINIMKLKFLDNGKFFIPTKKDWLVMPHQLVSWMSFEDFSMRAYEFLKLPYAPLCWIKFKNGEMKKFFLVWWSF